MGAPSNGKERILTSANFGWSLRCGAFELARQLGLFAPGGGCSDVLVKFTLESNDSLDCIPSSMSVGGAFVLLVVFGLRVDKPDHAWSVAERL